MVRASIRALTTWLCTLLPLSMVIACGRYHRYEPAPLQPQLSPSAFAARRLDDPDLIRFLSSLGPWRPDSGLTPTALGLSALYFRPSMGEFRAMVQAARAGEITAGTHPFAAANATVERAAHPNTGDASPWTLALSGGITLETGGKREARQVRARALTMAATLRVDATGWQLAQEARQAAVAVAGADRDVGDAEVETTALRTVLELLRARYAEGRVSLADIAQSETDVQTAVVALVQARRARTEARSALARALGVQLRQVEFTSLRDEARIGCATGDSIGTDGSIALGANALSTIALQSRRELGVAIAEYAIAEADLRVAVAQQYPDLTIGPGIAWNQGVGRWLLSVGSSAITTNRNRGPIAEAEAQRTVRAAHVAVVQDSILAQLDSGIAGCRDLRGDIAAADSLVATAAERLRLADASYARGETGQTEVALARLALVRVSRTQHQAIQRRQAAGAALEAVLGRWLTRPEIRWPSLLEPVDSTSRPPPPTENRK